MHRFETGEPIRKLLADVIAEMVANSPQAGVRAAEEALELAAQKLAEAQREKRTRP